MHVLVWVCLLKKNYCNICHPGASFQVCTQNTRHGSKVASPSYNTNLMAIYVILILFQARICEAFAHCYGNGFKRTKTDTDTHLPNKHKHPPHTILKRIRSMPSTARKWLSAPVKRTRVAGIRGLKILLPRPIRTPLLQPSTSQYYVFNEWRKTEMGIVSLV